MLKASRIPFFIGIILVLVIGGALYFRRKPEIAGKETLYELNKTMNPEFAEEHDYLLGLHQVSFWESHYGEKMLLAKSENELSTDEFAALIDGAVANGYVVQGGWDQVMEIKEREIDEGPWTIEIVDKGVNTVYGDLASVGQTYKEITLVYSYNKNTGEIFFDARATGDDAIDTEEET